MIWWCKTNEQYILLNLFTAVNVIINSNFRNQSDISHQHEEVMGKKSEWLVAMVTQHACVGAPWVDDDYTHGCGVPCNLHHCFFRLDLVLLLYDNRLPFYFLSFLNHFQGWGRGLVLFLDWFWFFLDRLGFFNYFWRDLCRFRRWCYLSNRFSCGWKESLELQLNNMLQLN